MTNPGNQPGIRQLIPGDFLILVGGRVGQHPGRINPGDRPGIGQLIPGDFLILVGELVGGRVGRHLERTNPGNRPGISQPRGSTWNQPTQGIDLESVN
ncbi:MAG: hypothetical protein ACYDH1_15945 [Anaerolineaceae bacterium]